MQGEDSGFLLVALHGFQRPVPTCREHREVETQKVSKNAMFALNGSGVCVKLEDQKFLCGSRVTGVLGDDAKQ